MYEENYQLLADAVIMQAVQDYRNSESQAVRDEVKRFFLSEIFCIYSSLDGKLLLEKIRTGAKRKNETKGALQCRYSELREPGIM